MQIDWNLVLDIAMPIITLMLGIWGNNYFRNKPKLISHLGFISGHRLNPQSPDQPPTFVNTHSVVIKNVGKKAATNVRLGHNIFPDVNVYPDIDYQIRDLPGGGKEIVFPVLIPKTEVTISYLYFPPTTWGKINTHIESDEGPAKVVTVLLQQQAKPIVLKFILALMAVGAVTVIYLMYQFIFWLVT